MAFAHPAKKSRGVTRAPLQRGNGEWPCAKGCGVEEGHSRFLRTLPRSSLRRVATPNFCFRGENGEWSSPPWRHPPARPLALPAPLPASLCPTHSSPLGPPNFEPRPRDGQDELLP